MASERFPQSGGGGDWIALEFQAAWLADRSAGRELEVQHYLARFPGHEELIRAEFASLESGDEGHEESVAPKASGSSATSADESGDTSPPDAFQLGPNRFRPGARFGSYRLRRELGRGGQGIVWLAIDERLGRPVALKVLDTWRGAGPDTVQRFQREAEVAARLDHPGVATVYEWGFEDGAPFLALRFIAGESLAALLREERSQGDTDAADPTDREALSEQTETAREHPGDATAPPESPVPPPDSSLFLESESLSSSSWLTPSPGRDRVAARLKLFSELGRALHFAHELGVVHRDVKPGNVMVTGDGRGVLTDFGLARSSEDLTLTQTGDVFGTPAYLAPEQLQATHGGVDPRTDLWALGVSLYESLALERPFRGGTREALFQAILEKEPPPLLGRVAGVTKDLDLVLRTALAKDPNRRYATAEALGADLDRILQGEPVRARPVPTFVKFWAWVRRNPALATALLGLFLVMAAALVATQVLLERTRESLAETEEGRSRNARLLVETQRERNRNARLLERYDQLADAAVADELLARAQALWPRDSARIPALRDWLERADDLLTREEEHREAVRGAREDAEPVLDERLAREAADARRRYPDFNRALDRARARRDRLLAKRADHPGLAVVARDLAVMEADPRAAPEALTRSSSDPVVAWRIARQAALLESLQSVRKVRKAIAARLAVARRVAETPSAEELAAWQQASERVAADQRFAPNFTLERREGLKPLGFDRDSGLFEVLVLGSGEEPERRGDFAAGTVQTGPEMGIVLVLVPGGQVTVGAQRKDPAKPHYDPYALGIEAPVRSYRLDPYFIGKYELTQGQWLSVNTRNPSLFQPGSPHPNTTVTLQQPVEGASVQALLSTAVRLGLHVPTEVQWEAAARAGTDTPWFTGRDPLDLAPFANLLGEEAEKDFQNVTPRAGYRDPWVVAGPVGTLRANPYGLHDILGNLSEAARERSFSPDRRGREGDGFRLMAVRGPIAVRGGKFDSDPVSARVSFRGRTLENTVTHHIGVRYSLTIVPPPIESTPR